MDLAFAEMLPEALFRQIENKPFNGEYEELKGILGRHRSAAKSANEEAAMNEYVGTGGGGDVA